MRGNDRIMEGQNHVRAAKLWGSGRYELRLATPGYQGTRRVVRQALQECRPVRPLGDHPKLADSFAQPRSSSLET